MQDLISRQAVLDGIEELKKSPWAYKNGFDYLIVEALDVVADLCVKQLPPVNLQQPKWIPVSERLPDDYQRVLVTVQTAYRKIVRSGTFMEEDTFWIDNGDFWKTTDIEIIAWMPLPEPYKEERSEEQA